MIAVQRGSALRSLVNMTTRCVIYTTVSWKRLEDLDRVVATCNQHMVRQGIQQVEVRRRCDNIGGCREVEDTLRTECERLLSRLEQV